MISNMYQRQFFNHYMKQCNNLYYPKNLNLNHFNMLGTNNNGFIRVNIINQRGEPPVTNATITIYVTDGSERDIPIIHLITTINPIRIELPMAYELGTQIAGPEYNFSTYNIRVDAFGYFANVVYNIRLFPNITTDFDIIMTPITPIERTPVLEERIDIPSHPRDEIL